MSFMDLRCNYTHLASNATTTLTAGAGFLHSITINTIGGSSNTLTISDPSAPGGAATIAVIDTTIAAAPTRIFDIRVSSLKAVMATGTAADVTICWLG